MKSILFSLLLVTVSLPAFAQTKADTNREVLRTYAKVYLDQKDYVGIENLILPYLPQDPSDPILWNYLGMAQMELNRFPQACESLEKASALLRDPKATKDDDRDFVVYHLAECYNRSGKERESVLLLNQLSTGGGELSSSAISILDLIQVGSIRAGHSFPVIRAAQRGHFLVSGAIGAGFDTNVLLVEDSVIGSVAVSDRGSAFVTPVVQLGYQGLAFDNRFDARYIASFTDYLASTVKIFNSLYQRADFMIGSGPIQWGVFADTLFLNRNPFQLYNWDFGVSWNHTRKIDSTHAWVFDVPVRFQKYVLDASVNEINDRTGGDVLLRATYRALRGDGIGSFVTQFALDNQYTKGSNYRLTGLTVPVYYTIALPGLIRARLINTFMAELSGQYYWQSDVSRKDLAVRAGAGMIWKASDEWNLRIDYSYFKNLSTIESARYTKNVFSLMLSHDFL